MRLEESLELYDDELVEINTSGLEMYSGFGGPRPFRGPSMGPYDRPSFDSRFGGPRAFRNASGGLDPLGGRFPGGLGFRESDIGDPRPIRSASYPTRTLVYDFPGSRTQIHLHADRAGNLAFGNVQSYDRDPEAKVTLNAYESSMTHLRLQNAGVPLTRDAPYKEGVTRWIEEAVNLSAGVAQDMGDRERKEEERLEFLRTFSNAKGFFS